MSSLSSPHVFGSLSFTACVELDRLLTTPTVEGGYCEGGSRAVDIACRLVVLICARRGWDGHMHTVHAAWRSLLLQRQGQVRSSLPGLEHRSNRSAHVYQTRLAHLGSQRHAWRRKVLLSRLSIFHFRTFPLLASVGGLLAISGVAITQIRPGARPI